MKASYKDGYHVAVGPLFAKEYMMIVGYGYVWAVAIERNNVPRKVLGLIAEHIGKLPQSGEAFCVKRDEEAQEEIFRVATEPLYRMTEETANFEALPLMYKTKLVFGGRNVWQHPGDEEVMLINPRYENIALCKSGAIRKVQHCLCVQGEFSNAFIGKVLPAKDEEALVQRMNKHLWV